MDKQKQIEEMAKTECVSKRKCNKDCSIQDEGLCDIYDTCETLYNAGYRKIPENAVVLETSVYESMEIKNYRDVISERVRKETAEKFAERVKMAFYYEFEELIPSIMSDKIDEIAKELTGDKV